MKQSEKLLKLKKVSNILTLIGVIIIFCSSFIPTGLGYDALWKDVLQIGAGIAFTGVVLRIARFLYLW